MKKFFVLILAIMLLTALCACGESNEPQPIETEEESTVVADDSGDIAAKVDDSGADTYILTEDIIDEDGRIHFELDEEKYELAQECVGESVDVLYEAIGEPEEEPHYASSCLEIGSEDGQLYYDSMGFYVNTLRNDDGEVVKAVVAYN